jgi:sugar lactone lactonase YvrE
LSLSPLHTPKEEWVTAAEQFTAPLAFHGEGAVWSRSWGGLRWVDMLAGEYLTRNDATGQISRDSSGSPIAALVRPRYGGGVVIATERGFTLEDLDGTRTQLPDLWSDAGRRMNEGGCAPDGSLYCGSLGYGAPAGAGSLYRLAADHAVSVIFSGVTISNGLGFSPDGALMYYVDTPTRRIDVFTMAEGRPVDRRPFAEVGDVAGNPDGLTVASDGSVWVALYGGSAVRGFNRSGEVVDVVELPVTNVTSCAFGGDSLDTLYITTSRENLPDDEQPEAGAVFACRPGVTGLPVLEYAG